MVRMSKCSQIKLVNYNTHNFCWNIYQIQYQSLNNYKAYMKLQIIKTLFVIHQILEMTQITITTIFYLSIMLSYIQQASAWSKFCSVKCTAQFCNSEAYQDCTSSCLNPWTFNVGFGTCELVVTSGWVLVDTSTDIGGAITPNQTTTSTCGPYASGSLWQYQYFGDLNGTVTRFTDSVGVQIPHYQIRVIFWAILIDSWINSDYISATLQGNQTQTQMRSTRQSSQKVCGNAGDYEDYLIFDKTFTHNTSNIYTIDISSNSNQRWGVKQLHVLAKVCHAACTACFGPLSTQCYACQRTTPMYLSGNTCNQTCLPGYGMMLDDINCVFCDLKCSFCFQLPTNCSACKSSGLYASFLYIDNSSCLTTCPVGYYGVTADRTCYLCDPTCLSCRNSPTYCYECNTTLGYAWNNYACYNPCPARTYLSNSGSNCSSCSPYCIACENSSTTCTVCQTVGTYVSYLSGTNCLTDCGNDFYQSTNGGTINTCQPCFSGCLQCTGNPTPCQACNPGYWLYANECGTSCPAGYFPEDSVWACLPIPPVANITILSQQQNLVWFNHSACSRELFANMKLPDTYKISQYTNFQIFTCDINQNTVNLLASPQVFILKGTSLHQKQNSFIAYYTITQYINLEKICFKMSNPIRVDVNQLIIRFKGPKGSIFAFYSDQQCQLLAFVPMLFTIVKFIVFAISGLGILSLCPKMIGLQLLNLLQTAYLSLTMMSPNFNLYLYQFKNLKYTTGLNIQIFNQNINLISNESLKYYYNELSIYVNLANNFNVMFVACMSLVCLNALIQVIKRCLPSRCKLSPSPSLYNIKISSSSISSLKPNPNSKSTLLYFPIKFVSQAIFTLVYFLSLSLPLYIYLSEIYSQQLNQIQNNQTAYLFNMVALIGICCTFAFSIISFVNNIDQELYGEYVQLFKRDFVNRIYVLLSIFYRVIIGITIALQINYINQTFLMVFVSLVFMLIFIVNLPFSSASHNYRSGIVHFTELSILVISHYYRNVKQNSFEPHFHILAYIIYGLIGFCVLNSSIMAIKEIIVKIRSIYSNYSKKKRYQIEEEQKNDVSKIRIMNNIILTENSFIE